jgi:hypothetical protein
MTDQFAENIDVKIREALRKEDAELLEHYRGEAPLHEMLIETFRGRHRWMTIAAFLATCLILVALIAAGYQFFHAEGTRAMIAWATAFVWGVVWIALMKIWFWLELNKNSLTREIKRLELQLANLSRQLAERK